MRDQRHMSGSKQLSTVTQVTAFWESQTILKQTTRKAYAYVNGGRWVADCPVCNGGIACWTENPDGACLDCGNVFKIGFPDDIEQVEAALEKRPTPRQNWLPGETIDMLNAENVRNR